MEKLIERNKLLSILLAFSLLVNLALAGWIWNTQGDIQNIILQNKEMVERIQALEREANITKQQMIYYRSQAEYYSSLLASKKAALPVSGKASLLVAAITQILGGIAYRLKGVIMNLTVELREGEGRILVNTVPRIGIDLQTSARTAVLVAENVTGTPLQRTDIIITITANQSTEIVDGPSAGAAIAIASIAAIKGDILRRDAIVTGTIDPEGRIGSVGGILEKAMAAAEHQINLFLVPKNEGKVLIAVPQVYHVGVFTIVLYEKKAVDVQEYVEEEGYHIRVMEVENIMDAYRIFTTPRE